MANNELHATAVTYGFSAPWVADVLENYGEDVLQACIDGAKHGFGISTLIELLKHVGPKLLAFIVSVKSKLMKLTFGAKLNDNGLIVGDDVGVVDATMLSLINEKYLQPLIEAKGGQLLQTILSSLLNLLFTPTPGPTPTPVPTPGPGPTPTPTPLPVVPSIDIKAILNMILNAFLQSFLHPTPAPTPAPVVPVV